MNNVLITGGTGFVGRGLLCRLLKDRNYHLRAAVRSVNTKLSDGVEIVGVEGLMPHTDWSAALAGVSIIVHAAARVHVMRDETADPLAEFRLVNVAGTLNLARQAAEAAVQRFVYISSIKVNGEETKPGRPFRANDIPAPVDAYGISKWETEQGLLAIGKETGMEVTIIRPSLVYGPGVKANFSAMMNLVAKGVPLPLGAITKNRRSLVSLDNLVDLIVTCMDHPAAANQIFLAGDGEDLSTSELLKRVAQAMDKPVRHISIPVWLLKSAAALIGKREVARRLCDSLQVDISKAHELLGWVPPVRVDQGLKLAIAHIETGQGKLK